MSTNKKSKLRKTRGLPLEFERVLGSNETYLRNVTELTGTLFPEPGLYQFFYFYNELEHLTASGTCSYIPAAKYVIELRPWCVVLTFQVKKLLISSSLNWKTSFIMFEASAVILAKLQGVLIPSSSASNNTICISD